MADPRPSSILPCLAVGVALVLNATACSEDTAPASTAPNSSGTSRIDLAQWQTMAGAGDANAQYALGLLYATGEGVGQNEAEALRWMTQAAEQGHRQAQYELGSFYTLEGSEDYEKAIRWLRLSAEQGYPPAQLSLGMLYAAGLGVAPDFSEALAWIVLAEDGGDPLAAEAKAELRLVMTEAEIAHAHRLVREYAHAGNRNE